MRINGISYPDVNNGTGCRVTVWVSGCEHHCQGCHNMNTWDKGSGRLFSEEDKKELFRVLSLPYIKGLTLSGGDPLGFYFNEVKMLCETVRERFPNKDIWCYTGYTLKDIENCYRKTILPLIDVLVDGRYIESKRNISLSFKGSENQIIWKKDEDGNFIKSKLN
nr:MAG TPA: 4Fe-4S single cluster domain protein [Bacteriophage sp.]